MGSGRGTEIPRATEQLSHSYWNLSALEPKVGSKRPIQWDAPAPQLERSLHLPHLEKAWGFPDSWAGNESACSVGDLGLIPGLGRSPGEGIGYPLQYSWASLVAQIEKSLPVMQKTWVGKIPWRRAWLPTPVFWPGESPWTEEPGGLQSTGLQRVRHDWVTKHSPAQRKPGSSNEEPVHPAARRKKWLCQTPTQDGDVKQSLNDSCPIVGEGNYIMAFLYSEMIHRNPKEEATTILNNTDEFHNT